MEADTIREIEKAYDALTHAVEYHTKKDEMNAATHLAAQPRYSPLTSRLQTAHEGLKRLLMAVD